MTKPSDESNVDPNPEAQKKYTDRVLGSISILCGILCIVTSMMPCFAWIVAGPGFVGLATGIPSLIKAKRDGMPATLSIVGIILNVVGIGLCIGIQLYLRGSRVH
jgi:hypothetical protein